MNLFSTSDIKSAFWQIELHEDSKDMTVFNTPTAHYRFKTMHFGLMNSPLTYLRLTPTVLHGMIGKTTRVLQDYVWLVSEKPEEHFKKLDLVFSRQTTAGLKSKIGKVQFSARQSNLPWHENDNALRTVKSKVDTVMNFPTPDLVDKIRSFLGVTGYYRHCIKGYTDIASPLNSLLKKDWRFTWSPDQQQAFETHRLKLIFPDSSKEFILCTDASDRIRWNSNARKKW